jgi:hypothetical protein
VKRLWTEIVHLPVRQRIALLLSVREEGHASVTLIFAESSVASIREIAKAVGMSANEFAQILGTLPLDDKAISKRLGATCKQVMGYRVSARRRLLRRMKFIVRGKPGS